MLKFLKVREVQLPTRGTEVSSGLDLYVPTDIKPEDIKITPLNEPVKLSPSRFVTEDSIIIPWWRGVLIPSWLKMILPKGTDEYTYDFIIMWKSWVSVKTDLLIWAAVIDNDYRGEFNIHVVNPGLNDVVIPKGSKIVQAIVRKVELLKPVEIDTEEFEKESNTERWEWWFWSTWA